MNTLNWILFFFFYESLDSITNVCSKLIACRFMKILILKTGEGLGFLFSKQNDVFLQIKILIKYGYTFSGWKAMEAKINLFDEVGVKE